jgi:hypothetical protein
MNSLSIETNTAKIDHGQRSWSSLVLRLCLTTAAVIVCYQFRWEAVRFLTSELQLRFEALLGLARFRLSPEAVLWKGHVYTYLTACTFADVWCGAIPLLWDLRRTWAGNLARVVSLAIGLLLFNVLRLTLSDVLYAGGAPWVIAHDVVAGFAYFAVWVWLWHHAGWRNDQEISI